MSAVMITYLYQGSWHRSPVQPAPPPPTQPQPHTASLPNHFTPEGRKLLESGVIGTVRCCSALTWFGRGDSRELIGARMMLNTWARRKGINFG